MYLFKLTESELKRARELLNDLILALAGGGAPRNDIRVIAAPLLHQTFTVAFLVSEPRRCTGIGCRRRRMEGTLMDAFFILFFFKSDALGE